MNDFFEISEQTPDGRRRIKIGLHEIYPDETHCNLNGITYLEESTRTNAESIVGMPICAAFLDDEKDVPYDHGLTGYDGCTPLYEDSVQVGAADGWSIEDIVVDGELKKICCAVGYINGQRYPSFVKWLEKRMALKISTYGSVEFVGTKDNKSIIYKDGKTREDKYRVPIQYTYSGYCILTVKPSDSAAVMVELNQLSENKEELYMDEKILSAFVADIKSTIVEMNSKDTNYETKIAELNEAITAKDAEIEEANARCKIAEDNEAEMKAKLDEKEAAAKKAEDEMNACKKEAQINELNSVLAGYSDAEKEYAKEDIEKFTVDPVGCGMEINQIATKIDAASYRKLKEAHTAETNSQKETFQLEDIFAEVNSASNTENVLDLDGMFN